MATISNSTARVPALSAEIDGTSLILTFADARKLSVDTQALSESIILSALLHGIEQKLRDAAAIGRDPVTGRSATLEDKYNAVREVYDRITSVDGTWNKIRTGEGAVPTGGLLVRALMQLSGKDRDAIVEQLAGLSKEQVSALRKNKRVAEAIASLREASDDSDELLDGLLG